MTIVNAKNVPIKKAKDGSWKRVISWKRKLQISAIVAFVVLCGIGYAWYVASQYVWHIGSPVDFHFRVQSPIHLEKLSEVQGVTGLIQVAEAKSEVVEPLSPKDMMKLDVCNAFGFKQDSDECKTALAITEAESHFNPRAMGWNCKYSEYNKETKKVEQISTHCKANDRSKAWSVDCGLMQINVYGQVCPEEYFDIPFNLKLAVGKYKGRGNTWGAWSAFTSSAYLQYKAK